MSKKQGIIFKAVAVLALVCIVVFAVRSFASSKKITAERLDQEVAALAFADWSENSGGAAEAKKRV